MADKPASALYKLTNEQPGPRGIWSDGVLSYVDPGATVLAELTDEDKTLADKHGHLKIEKASAADAKAIKETAAPAA